MKDFTTAEHITPILTEIKAKYKINTSAAIKNYFNCSLLLENPTTRAAYPVSPEKDLYIPHLENFKKLCINIQDYATAAETTPGELDEWTENELKSVFNAIKNTLIKEYSQK